MTVRDLGEVVRGLREQAGMTQEALGDVVGVTHSAISKIERGRQQTIDHVLLTNLAHALGVKRPTLEALLVRGEHVVPEPASPEMPREIPIVADLSAGHHGGLIDGYEYVPLSDTRGRLLRAARVSGTCMEPEIRQGDVVIFDANREPRDGQVVAAVIHDPADDRGRGVIKRFSRSHNGRVQLAPNVGEPLVLPAGQVRIEGVVVEVRRKLPA